MERLRILLVEYDDAFARAAGEMLKQAGDTIGEIITVKALDAAQARLVTEPFDLILLDFALPDGAGMLNVARLRETSPRVPVIVVGAEDDEALALEAVHVGAQDYLVKGQLTPRWLLRSLRYARERHAADMALVEARENYRGIFNHLVEGIFQTTPDGRYLLANLTLARIYGYASPEELVNSVTDIGRRLYVDASRRAEFRRIMEEHDTISGFESEIYRKDGTTIWISENCRAVRDAQGKLLHYEGTVEDITQRRQAEENLRHSEALYHSLVETMPQSIFRKDIRGHYTFANPQFCRAVGKRSEEILGRTIYDFFPSELAEAREHDDLTVMRDGKLIEQTEENKFPGGEHQFIQVIKMPIRDANGKVVGLQGMFWDITAQKLAEERIRQASAELARSREELRLKNEQMEKDFALRREAEAKVKDSEALYHSLVETLSQNIFRKDLEERFTFGNRQFCKTLGKSLEEIVGKTDYDFFPKELAAKYQQDDAQVMAARQSFETVEEHLLPNGDQLFVQVVKTPLIGATGQVIGLQGMFWDITAQKLAEERIRKASAELARSQEELRVKNLLMQDDLKMAREIQLTMLPQQYPAVPRGASPAESAIQFTHRYLPTGTVGGDFFSVAALGETEVAVFICDVAGHGVRSALVTAMARALVEELRPLAHDPGQFMTKLNSDLFAILKHSGTPVLTTAFYLVADTATGAIRYANAGHPKPLHLRRRSGTVEVLSNAAGKSQPALGLFASAPYQTSESNWAAGDLVMLFTDGLYEVNAANGDIFTQEMLTEATRQRLQAPANELFDGLLASIRAYSANGEFDDDVCLVGMEFTGLAAARPA